MLCPPIVTCKTKTVSLIDSQNHPSCAVTTRYHLRLNFDWDNLEIIKCFNMEETLSSYDNRSSIDFFRESMALSVYVYQYCLQDNGCKFISLQGPDTMCHYIIYKQQIQYEFICLRTTDCSCN